MENTGKMFELATRRKLRFPYKGQISTEDLWDLVPKSLDSIFKLLNAKKKLESEESLLGENTVSSKVSDLDLQLEIIRYVVRTKLDEADRAQREFLRSQQKQKIMGIIAGKQDEALASKSINELKKLLDEL